MSHTRIKAVQYLEGSAMASTEALTREEALQIKINGESYTVTMRTPGHDRLLTAGLLFTEGIIGQTDNILDMLETPTATGDSTLAVDVRIEADVIGDRNLFNRSIASSASCGVCGKVDLCDLVVPVQRATTPKKLRIDLIPGMLDHMRKLQSTFAVTGGSHAAALLTVEGHLLSVQEDIGRHNAVDKVIGDLFLKRTLHLADVLLISGRVSYEIVAKCAQAKVSFLLAVSAPSSLAVEFCDIVGITLVGFCREYRATVYTHPENIEAIS